MKTDLGSALCWIADGFLHDQEGIDLIVEPLRAKYALASTAREENTSVSCPCPPTKDDTNKKPTVRRVGVSSIACSPDISRQEKSLTRMDKGSADDQQPKNYNPENQK